MSLINNLLNSAAVIRDATQVGENTALRVGGFLVNLVQAIVASLPEKIADGEIVDVNATDENFVISLRTKDSDGNAGVTPITIPAATVNAAGLMTAEDRVAFNNFSADFKRYSNADDVTEPGVYFPVGNPSQLILFVDVDDNGTIYQTQVGQNYKRSGHLIRSRTIKNGVWPSWTYHNAPNCVVKKASGSLIKVYSKMSDNAGYICFHLRVENNYIRLAEAFYCTFDNSGTFHEEFQVLLQNENEFAIRDANRDGDGYVGGFHGYETADLTKARVLIDGKAMKVSDILTWANGDYVYCESVMLRVVSNIENTNGGAIRHTKETEIRGGGYKVTNFIINPGAPFDCSDLISGLVCVHKNAATAVLTSNPNEGAISLNGSDAHYYSPEKFQKLNPDESGDITFYNMNNDIACVVNSRVNAEFERDEHDYTFMSGTQIEVWDREHDSKFYFRQRYSTGHYTLHAGGGCNFSSVTTVTFKKYIKQ